MKKILIIAICFISFQQSYTDDGEGLKFTAEIKEITYYGARITTQDNALKLLILSEKKNLQAIKRAGVGNEIQVIIKNGEMLQFFSMYCDQTFKLEIK